MGDLIRLDFRDRRRVPEQKPVEAAVEFANKNEVHEHLRTAHGYGGPKSQSRADLERIHEDRHVNPPGFGTPHSHR